MGILLGQLIEESGKDIEIPLDSQIPILIIQPLVENSVRHGISKKKQGGVVYLRLKQANEGIY